MLGTTVLIRYAREVNTATTGSSHQKGQEQKKNPPFHTPYISSPNHCLLFAAHPVLIQLTAIETLWFANPFLLYTVLQ